MIGDERRMLERWTRRSAQGRNKSAVTSITNFDEILKGAVHLEVYCEDESTAILCERRRLHNAMLKQAKIRQVLWHTQVIEL